MNKSIITHAAWLAVAAGAFAGGMAIKGNDTASSDAGSNGAGPNGLPSAIEAASKEQAGSKSADGSNGTGTGSGMAFASNRSTKALLADYLTSNDPLEQNFLFAQLLLGVTPENAAEIYESLKGKLTGRDGGRQMTLFFQAWGKVDGDSAIAAASEGGLDMRGGPGRGNGFNVGAVLAGWAGSDPEAAKVWLGEQEDDRMKGFLTFGLINGLAKSDPDSATEYVIELAQAQGDDAPQTPWGGSFTTRYIDMIAEEKLTEGTIAATAWAEGLPEGEMRSSAFDEIAENLARTDLEGARDWIAQHAGEDHAAEAVREIGEQIAREDPEQAIAWADSLPENAQSGVYREALESWTREDPQAASEYLATLNPSTNRDAAVGSFATSLARARDEEQRDPESAATWALTIDDESIRTSTVTEVARSWIRTDQEAATAWLPNSGLSTEAQAEIIASPGGGDRGFDFGGRGRGR